MERPCLGVHEGDLAKGVIHILIWVAAKEFILNCHIRDI